MIFQLTLYYSTREEWNSTEFEILPFLFPLQIHGVLDHHRQVFDNNCLHTNIHPWYLMIWWWWRPMNGIPVGCICFYVDRWFGDLLVCWIGVGLLHQELFMLDHFMLKVYAAHWALTSTLLSSAAQVFNPSYQIGLAKVSVLLLKRSPLIASYSPSPQQCVPPFFHFFFSPQTNI